MSLTVSRSQPSGTVHTVLGPVDALAATHPPVEKRRYGLARSRLKGHEGVKIWVGYGVLAHNMDQMVALS
ncbi:MAG: hypothetical protein NVS3B21_34790 [Acidimicrobiales bacterium]